MDQYNSKYLYFWSILTDTLTNIFWRLGNVIEIDEISQNMFVVFEIIFIAIIMKPNQILSFRFKQAFYFKYST